MKKIEKDQATATEAEKKPTSSMEAKAEEPASQQGNATGSDTADQEEEEVSPREEDGEETGHGEDLPDEEDREDTGEETAAPAQKDTSETERLKADLLAARSQLAAYAAGVAPEMVADAVTLATAEAQAAGEVTEEAVTKAMANVLKRHPEWNSKPAAGGKKITGGFKLGADPDSAGSSKGAVSEKGSKKPWNKFNR